ncbi:RrF2 family transcriptional regulator [Candidatus Contubernalis alkaliaceticus]|uniref:RrF2 family transcriptional regulator n=1 Tax=Candidatus Contubernalis alkaliaceticus TaxID=338645 RepID=UPI001F4C12EF|nr:Rrf2 family transcriptional regulator [Candidatus Contubernalis alkalaceticus]UNC91424.1 Rrf2 family transcriptional regulator [Candidatus Contubernalis alkalaceticus]
MKLTTKGEYGVRAMVVLALNYRDGPTPIKEIGRREGISPQYLEQIFLDLRRADLVNSIRGAKGGYTLARHPSEISIGDVVRVLEGPIAPMECVAEGSDSDCCERTEGCLTRGVWEKLRDRMNEVLDDISLEDMISSKNIKS